METLEGLVRLNVPAGSVIQFTLLADPDIEPYLTLIQGAEDQGFRPYPGLGGAVHAVPRRTEAKGFRSSTASRYATFGWWCPRSSPQVRRA